MSRCSARSLSRGVMRRRDDRDAERVERVLVDRAGVVGVGQALAEAREVDRGRTRLQRGALVGLADSPGAAKLKPAPTDVLSP